ncbi:PAS domain-containing protein [Algihabitans albus]|uniref:hypothetical protein n=1 Tax=Algihabitans albus TaxID=2164067 RepID=UPI0013C313A9|nr:hypothetical protein [Algihabitans albus]
MAQGLAASQQADRLLQRLSACTSIVAHLSLIERRGDAGERLFYRFAGSEAERAAGRTMAGRSLALLPTRNGWIEQVMRNVAIVQHTGRPLYSEGAFLTFRNGGAGVRASCELLLPLFDAAAAPSSTLMLQKVCLLDRAHSEPFLFADDFRPGRRVLVGQRSAKQPGARAFEGQAGSLPPRT